MICMVAGVWDSIGKSILEGLKAAFDYFSEFLQTLSCTLIGAALEVLPDSLQPSDTVVQEVAKVYSTVNLYVPLGFGIDLLCAYMTFYVLFYVVKILLMLF